MTTPHLQPHEIAFYNTALAICQNAPNYYPPFMPFMKKDVLRRGANEIYKTVEDGTKIIAPLGFVEQEQAEGVTPSTLIAAIAPNAAMVTLTQLVS